MADRLAIGLIGCGSFARAFAPYVLEFADIAALCSAQKPEMESLATQLGLKVPQYADFREMVQQRGLDAVVITAPNHVHADATVAAADAGLHVFCEKAMARTIEECWRMVRACERNGRKLMIGHKRRLRPPWARMIELTRPGGPLGEPLAINVCAYADLRSYRHFESWCGDPKLSGGVLHVVHSHVIDWFRAMCGEATRVTAQWGPQHDTRYKGRDVMHATFAFKSGAVASITCGSSFPLHTFREAEGPWGECRDGGLMLEPHLDHIDLHWKRLDDSKARVERFDDLGFDHAYRRELKDFVDWVREDRTPCLTWIEGLRCVEMMQAAYASADAWGTPTALPLRADLENPPVAPPSPGAMQSVA
jgi:predicted dehydrogenase